MNSKDLYSYAEKIMPGGVSSPVRAIRPNPFYTVKGRKSHITTLDKKALIDCCMAYGPLILGHAHPVVRQKITEQLDNGWLYGTPTPVEPEYAKLLIRDHPGIDMLRFVSTGSEATMAAIRLARGYTEKSDIIKIEGGFHGAHDAVLVKAGSGATTMGVPDSAGVLPDLVRHTCQVPYNDIESLSDLACKNENIAAMIIEPVLGNIGPVLPENDYLKEVRDVTKENNILLIFDEVITGYRIGIGGAQSYFGVTPDITTLGKIIGGGLPIGAFGGKEEIMKLIAPSGPVYQAGTFSGNPLSLTAGLATIEWLHSHKKIYKELQSSTELIGEELKGSGDGSFVSIGSMFKYFFREKKPCNYKEVNECNIEKFSIFWQKMLNLGIFLPPSQFETNFLSVVHSEKDLTKIIRAYKQCLS